MILRYSIVFEVKVKLTLWISKILTLFVAFPLACTVSYLFICFCLSGLGINQLLRRPPPLE